jgi:uncharacterized membrane protein YidH (DUF202 family)
MTTGGALLVLTGIVILVASLFNWQRQDDVVDLVGIKFHAASQ